MKRIPSKSSKILNLLGWSERIKVKGSNLYKKPFVACLSHTSGVHEFILYWLYCQSNSELKKSCLVMSGKNNKLFKKQPWRYVLSKVNLILLGNDRWNKPQGRVNNIVQEVLKKKYKYTILSPEGKDNEAGEWRSGYYYIGKKLNWGYRVVGFDFETKRFTM